jgi:nucleoside-diphosphate-sugar epimerase
MAHAESALTVAVTGPTGTFGFGLLPLLQADERIEHVIGIARRPFDPAAHGWTKMAYRQGDVRDAQALRRAFHGADVVIHLAFMVTGLGRRRAVRAVNVGGTLNAFRAAAGTGARRFVSASSVAAYGFHRDNPMGMTEQWPVRPAARLFYAQEKAELERLLQAESQRHPDLGLYLLRPPVVVGPHTLGRKSVLPSFLDPLTRLAGRAVGRRVPVPVPAPAFALQLIHESDVGQAFHLCALGAGPPGAYNIAGDGVLTVADVVRELGYVPVPVPTGAVQAAARLALAVPRLPLTPAVVDWFEVLSQPAIMDVGKAKRELGFQPRYSGLEALRDSLGRGRAARPGSLDGGSVPH